MSTDIKRTRPPGSWERDTTITAADADSIRTLIDEHGERDAARMMRVDRHTIARALAFLPLRHATVSFIRMRLVEIAAGESRVA